MLGCPAAPARVSAHTHLNKMQQEEKKAEILEATVSPGFVALWMVDSGQWSPRAPTPGHQRPRPGADQINVGLQRGVEVYSTVQYSTVQCSAVR